MSPKITIIIPMYNVEKYLPRCLDSVLSQTFTDWQAILVDDGSPDKSRIIADKYAAQDNRFIVIHKQNAGVSAARNDALNVANGEYIMFLDSDDCIHPQTMEILYGLATRENADVVSFDYDRVAYKSPDATAFPAGKMPEYFKTNFDLSNIKYKYVKNLITRATNEDLGASAWYVQTGMTTMRMYRRAIISGLQFDTTMRVLEDTVFWSQVLLRRPNGVITQLPLYFYTVNTTSALRGGAGQSSVVILSGFARVADEYRNVANRRDMRIWYKRFFWSVMPRILHGAMRMNNVAEKQKIAMKFLEMKNQGTLDITPDFHAWRYARRIKKFIAQTV